MIAVVRCIGCGTVRRANLSLGHSVLCAGRCHTLTIHSAVTAEQRAAFVAAESARKAPAMRQVTYTFTTYTPDHGFTRSTTSTLLTGGELPVLNGKPVSRKRATRALATWRYCAAHCPDETLSREVSA